MLCSPTKHPYTTAQKTKTILTSIQTYLKPRDTIILFSYNTQTRNQRRRYFGTHILGSQILILKWENDREKVSLLSQTRKWHLVILEMDKKEECFKNICCLDAHFYSSYLVDGA